MQRLRVLRRRRRRRGRAAPAATCVRHGVPWRGRRRRWRVATSTLRRRGRRRRRIIIRRRWWWRVATSIVVRRRWRRTATSVVVRRRWRRRRTVASVLVRRRWRRRAAALSVVRWWRRRTVASASMISWRRRPRSAPGRPAGMVTGWRRRPGWRRRLRTLLREVHIHCAAQIAVARLDERKGCFLCELAAKHVLQFGRGLLLHFQPCLLKGALSLQAPTCSGRARSRCGRPPFDGSEPPQPSCKCDPMMTCGGQTHEGSSPRQETRCSHASPHGDDAPDP